MPDIAESRALRAFTRGLRSGAAWIALALTAQLATAHAQNATTRWDARNAIPVSELDLAPSRQDFAPSPPEDVTFPTPGRATSMQRSAVPDVAPETPSRPGEVSHLDLTPIGSILRAPVFRATLPPEAPPPSISAEITSYEGPAPATAPIQHSTDPAPAATPDLTTPPASADAPVDLGGPVQAALAALNAPSPAAHSLGAGDWGAAREAVRVFYSQRNYAPVWVDNHGLTPSGRSALARLKRAREDGLDLAAFALPEPDFASSSPDRLAQIETTLSSALVAYALQATGARIAPTSISPLVTAHPAVADPGKALGDVATAADPGDALAAYNPPQKGYQELRAQLARVREAAPSAISTPKGPTLLIGMQDPRVPLIRARFGLGAQPAPNSAQIYDARVASAVAAFQRTHGLAADGALTNATSEALFGDPNARREATLLANMEMWRWEPRDMGATRVEVNVPDFTLRVMNGEDEVHRARVIVGKPDTPTPIFSNEIKYILLNPIWRVPDSIIKKEMEPKLASDPDYLTKHGFKVTTVGNRLVVEQPPGEGNALGHILFMFPNEHAVYLHDTPSRGLFATNRRAYSHGCIRVEGPARLAEMFMGGAARGWTAERVQSMIGTNERTVFLPRPVPIHIEYFTAFVDETGALQEREDVYGLTARVAATLSRLRQD